MSSDTNKKQYIPERLNSPKHSCFSPKRRPLKMLYADIQLIKVSSEFSKNRLFFSISGKITRGSSILQKQNVILHKSVAEVTNDINGAANDGIHDDSNRDRILQKEAKILHNSNTEATNDLKDAVSEGFNYHLNSNRILHINDRILYKDKTEPANDFNADSNSN